MKIETAKIPASERAKKYPFEKLEAGSEKCITVKASKDNVNKVQSSLTGCAKGWAKRNEIQASFTTRRVVDTEKGVVGVRIWRTK